jgi:hypothetical protein
MSHVLVVQYDGQKHVHKLQLSSESPISIGRAWDNDVIIEDEYIDAKHLQLFLDNNGQPCIRDLESKNGSVVVLSKKTKKRKQKLRGQTEFPLGSSVWLGDSSATLFDAATAVRPALSPNITARLTDFFNFKGGAVLVGVLIVLGFLFELVFQGSSEVTSELIATSVIAGLAVIFGWSLLAGVVGKLLRHRAAIRAHWVFAGLFSVAAVLATFALQVFHFNANSNSLSALAVHALSALGLLVFAYGTLSLATRFNTSSKLSMALCMSVALIIANVVVPQLKEDHKKWSYYADVAGGGMPPEFYFGKPITVEDHIQRTSELFAVLDAQVGQAEPVEIIDDGIKQPADTEFQLSNAEPD